MGFKVALDRAIAASEEVGKLPKLQVKASYRFARLVDQVAPSIKEYEKQRLKLLTTIGVPVEGRPGTFSVPNEKLDEFNKTISDLMSEEIEVSLEPVTLDMLEGVDLEPTALARLGPFVSE